MGLTDPGQSIIAQRASLAPAFHSFGSFLTDKITRSGTSSKAADNLLKKIQGKVKCSTKAKIMLVELKAPKLISKGFIF